jgi:hypothetical protein
VKNKNLRDVYNDEENNEESIFLKNTFYRYLKIQLNQALAKNPKNVTLKLLLAQLLRQKLRNQFKAIFELISCETQNLSFSKAFTVFRMK